MCEASPTRISLSPSELAPTVGRRQFGSEQSQPACLAIRSFVFGENSSLFAFLAIGAGLLWVPAHHPERHRVTIAFYRRAPNRQNAETSVSITTRR